MAVIAMAPASVITIAMTTANLGRSMKIPENMRCSVSRRNGCRNNLARTDFLNTLHNYNFAGFEPLRDDDVAPLFDACRDTSLFDLFCVVDHQDVVACLVQQYGGLRHEK